MVDAMQSTSFEGGNKILYGWVRTPATSKPNFTEQSLKNGYCNKNDHQKRAFEKSLPRDCPG